MSLASFDPSSWLIGWGIILIFAIFGVWFAGELLVKVVKWARQRQGVEARRR
jgi:hypothetical protein